MTSRLTDHGSGTAIAEGEPGRRSALRPSPPPPRTPRPSLRQPTFRCDLATQVTGALFQLMIVRKQVRRWGLMLQQRALQPSAGVENRPIGLLLTRRAAAGLACGGHAPLGTNNEPWMAGPALSGPPVQLRA